MPDHEELEQLLARFIEAGCDTEGLLKAHQKQSPLPVHDKKPSDRIIGRFHGYCPSCGEFVGVNRDEVDPYYCSHCGQRIDWTDDNKRNEDKQYP